jgi:hypothetical protein
VDRGGMGRGKEDVGEKLRECVGAVERGKDGVR